MAKKEEVLRDYTMSDGAMVQLTDRLISAGTRDSAELIPEGVTTARLTALQDQLDDYNDMEDDEEWAGLISIKVEDKNGFLDLCETEVRNMRRRAKNIYGEKSAKYKRFGFDGINKLEEAPRIKAYYRIWRRGTAALSDLTPEGLTAPVLDNFKTQIDNANQAIDIIEDTIEDRDIATEDRNTLGNEIFAEDTKIAETGKDYWFDKNEAKYNDYVINDTAGPSYPHASVTVAAGAVANVPLPSVDFEAIAFVKLEAKRSPANFGASETIDGAPGPTHISLEADTDITKTSDDAKAQLAADETHIYINVQNTGSISGTYKITLIPVA